MKKSEVRKAGDLPNWIVEFHKKIISVCFAPCDSVSPKNAD